MRLTWISLALVLAIFALVVVAVFGLSTDRARRDSTRLLAAFLLALASSLLNFLYVVSGGVEVDPRFAFLGNTLGLASAPLLYLYAASLAVAGFRLHARSLLHLLPAVAVLALVLSAYTLQPVEVQRAILHDRHHPSPINSWWLPAGVFAYVLAYLALIVRLLWRHRALFPQQQAASGTADLAWLRISLAGSIALALFDLARALLLARWPLGWLDSALLALEAAAAFALALYFLVQALRQSGRAPAPVAMTAAPLAALADAESEADKYGPHRLDEAELLAYAGQIDAHLRASGAHLQGAISIGELADQLPMSARELSQTLNRHFRLSFFDYINRHRCEHAQRLLRERADATVTEIQLECGFASKSSFYAAFRKWVGMTPVEYRRRHAAGSTPSPADAAPP